jgi:hypothetical protein
MKKRIGYYGLSSPVYYDYKNTATPTAADRNSSPNPILEGAFGAMLLFDELWFVSRSMCPQNMRDLPYVHFLDERNMVPNIDPEWLPDPKSIFCEESLNVFHCSSARYKEVYEDLHIYWDAAADNHTHELRINDVYLNGSSWDINNVLFDILVVERLNQEVELVTNSFTDRLLISESINKSELKLTEILIIDDVPQFISPRGPYHPCLEEIRESVFMTDFRKWIINESLKASSKEITQIKMEIEAKLSEYQRTVTMRYLDPKGLYKSLGKTILGIAADALMPGSATIKDIVSQLGDERKKKAERWQGFILDAKTKLPST